MLAMVIWPRWSEISVGSWMQRAPRPVVSAQAWWASSTQRAMARTPSPWLCDVAGDLGVGAEGGGEDEADFSLLEDVGGAVALAGFRACVRYQAHAEGRAIEVGRLACVADVELDVVGTFEGEKIVCSGRVATGSVPWM